MMQSLEEEEEEEQETGVCGVMCKGCALPKMKSVSRETRRGYPREGTEKSRPPSDKTA